jgi:glycosyltransferase involved in cell wall biosynthesis
MDGQDKQDAGQAPRIVAFTKDWNDVPTCTTHILRIMGRTMPVLWIESIGTRKINPVIGKDWRRVWRRLRRAFSGAEIKENQLRVLAPLVIPKAESRVGQWVNRRLIQWQIGRELRRMGNGPVEYWCFVPNAVDLLPRDKHGAPSAERQENPHPTPPGRGVQEDPTPLPSKSPSLITGHSLRIVYYCVDDWSQFHNLDGAWLARKENELLRRADVVFAASRFLVEKCRRIAGDRVVYMSHGVDHALFAQALDPAMKEPQDLAPISHPRIGFYGNLHPWVDLEVVGSLAEGHPEWQFVLIGEIYCDVTRISSLPNVHLLGRREHRQLPAYCKGFDVAIIPYDMTQSRMESVNPVKTKELLAAGIPVVAADIPELRGMGADVRICKTRVEWTGAIACQLEGRDRLAISCRVLSEGWVVKVGMMRKEVKESCLVTEETGDGELE